MDISEILGGGGHAKRPDHPDFFRILTISQKMKADMLENAGNPEKQEELWRKTIEELVDFDSLSYHAIQIALHIAEMQGGVGVMRMLTDPAQHAKFVATVQAFYDGFIMGAFFQKEGGHQS